MTRLLFLSFEYVEDERLLTCEACGRCGASRLAIRRGVVGCGGHSGSGEFERARSRKGAINEEKIETKRNAVVVACVVEVVADVDGSFLSWLNSATRRGNHVHNKLVR